MLRTKLNRAWWLGLIGPLVLLAGCGGSSGGHGMVDLAAAKEAAKLKGLPAGHDPAQRATRPRGGARQRTALGKQAGKAISR